MPARRQLPGLVWAGLSRSRRHKPPVPARDTGLRPASRTKELHEALLRVIRLIPRDRGLLTSRDKVDCRSLRRYLASVHDDGSSPRSQSAPRSLRKELPPPFRACCAPNARCRPTRCAPRAPRSTSPICATTCASMQRAGAAARRGLGRAQGRRLRPRRPRAWRARWSAPASPGSASRCSRRRSSCARPASALPILVMGGYYGRAWGRGDPRARADAGRPRRRRRSSARRRSRATAGAEPVQRPPQGRHRHGAPRRLAARRRRRGRGARPAPARCGSTG